MKKAQKLAPAMAFIVLFGVVSLFSDMTHEGAASIKGAYLALLGASAGVIGFVSGLGELVGYSLRYLFGRLADRTGKYWTLTIVGYAVDGLAVPALALATENGWIFACAMMIIERTGKAIKKPAKDTLLSFAASRQGVGKSFAIQEALDQAGAFLGPLLLALAMLIKRSGTTFERYAFCFALLGIPAAVTLILLFITKRKFPDPGAFEPDSGARAPFRVNRPFLLYVAGISLFAFGFVDYALVAMHIMRGFSEISADALPLIYAGAMFVDALAALAFGILYDKKGVGALILSTLISAPFAIFVFLIHSVPALLVGVALWGVGMGAQESVLKAAVASMVPKAGRATGYGIFECAFGIFWFLGSWFLGMLYGSHIAAMVAVSVAAQLVAVPLYFFSARPCPRE